MGSLITIWWRDIPMQVIARDGRTTAKRVLDKRFQIAVDKAGERARGLPERHAAQRRLRHLLDDRPRRSGGATAAAGYPGIQLHVAGQDVQDRRQHWTGLLP